MKNSRSVGTSVNSYQIIRRSCLEDGTVHIHFLENLRYCVDLTRSGQNSVESRLLKLTRDGLHCVPAYESVDNVRLPFVL
jgi:hypothetical protein